MRITGSKTLKEAYKYYTEDIPETSPFFVDYKTYRDICQEFNKSICKYILEESGEFQLPYRLGSLRIKKTKMDYDKINHMRPDWKKTKEVGKTVYHLNDHTDGYRYRWAWNKSSVVTVGKKLYSFYPTRTNKRELAKLLKDDNNNIDYFE